MSSTELRMRAFCHYPLIILVACLFVQSTAIAQIVRRDRAVWVGLKSGIVFRLRRYQLKEENEGDVLRDFIKRKADKDWIPFYMHRRAIVATLAHAEHLVLINDYEATKSNKIIVVDLDTRKAERIDLEVINTYKRNASPDVHMIIIPTAHAFSPSDKQVLIKMELIDLNISFEEKALADRLRRSYKRWWYVVDSRTGNLQHEYRTSRRPKRWWAY